MWVMEGDVKSPEAGPSTDCGSGWPGATALFPMLCTVSRDAGVGESVRTLASVLFFIVGYGVDSYSAVKLKARLGRIGDMQ